MTDLRYESTTTPTDCDIATVRASLRAYNRRHAGPFVEQPLAVFARDHGGNIVGGATGEVTWGWLYVSMLWVHRDYRGQGVGEQLLTDIEALADNSNVTGYHLGTTSFQALDFYKRCGYQVWGELPDFPPGHINYSLAKRAKRAKGK